jgi:hypothetical protein
MNLNINKKKISVFIFCLLYVLPSLCQKNLDNIQASFDEFRKTSFNEKIFAHTDKDFYLAGEIIWFKLYVVSADDNKPTSLSRVAYVEVVDKDQKPVLQCKIALDKGAGNGSLYLPGSLNSGVYKIRAYTNWMKNFTADYYFEKPITVINSLRNLNMSMTRMREYEIQFFPEGGNLVEGIQSKVAFKIADPFGKGVDCKGIVISNNGDTVTQFQPLKFGIGNFEFMPAIGHSYKAIVKLSDTSITRELPTPLDEGYVLTVTGVNDTRLKISISTNIKAANEVYLFIHTRQTPKAAERIALVNGRAEYIIEKNKLGDGISHITVFNGEGVPVCERLFFLPPEQKLTIHPTVAAEQFTSRKKVTLMISSTGGAGASVPADMSLSVYRIDSLQLAQQDGIGNYVWLTSELKGQVESPGYYFSEKGPEAEQATDNLMLTHGWRRFTWQNILQHTKPLYHFVPEYKGHIIYGRVTYKQTGLPAANVVAYLSIPGSHVQMYDSRSDGEGNVLFFTKDFFGSNEIVLETDERTDTAYKVEIMNPFSEKFSSENFPLFAVSDKMKSLLSDYSVSAQVQNTFSAEKLKRFYMAIVDTNAFYGVPDAQYKLDNYTRFSTMEEVLREYVLEVLVRRQRENFRFIVTNGDNKLFLNDPLTLLNGVPVFDPNKIIKYDPLKVKNIEVVARKYFYGPSIFNGIVNFVTYQPDPSILSELNSAILEYEGMQYQREFYSPTYENSEQVTSRMPDFRNVLYWSPSIQSDAQGKAEINFYTSDLKGKYIGVIQGMSHDGRVGENSFFFEVK